MANVYTGGDILSITCNHPTLGNFNFKTKSNESYTIDPGGIRNADDANSVTGDGTPVYIKNRVMAFIEGVIYTSPTEFEAVPNLSASSENATWTIEMLSGTIYKLLGQPVGDFQIDTNAGSASVKIAGGRMQIIS